jgi:hypothetical protein
MNVAGAEVRAAIVIPSQFVCPSGTIAIATGILPLVCIAGSVACRIVMTPLLDIAVDPFMLMPAMPPVLEVVAVEAELEPDIDALELDIDPFAPDAEALGAVWSRLIEITSATTATAAAPMRTPAVLCSRQFPSVSAVAASPVSRDLSGGTWLSCSSIVLLTHPF